MQNKIGIFGGSFDPIHTGHLIICNIIKEELNLDKIIFVPAFRSPHKAISKFTSPQVRLKMVELAIEDNKGFEISDFEISQGRSVYSIETIEHMKKKYSEAELYFIIGADSFKDISKWKDPELIRDKVKLVIASRDNLKVNEEDYLAKTPNIEISSSMIRDRISKKLSIKYLVNSNVEHYIYKKSLYK
ncbi:MAG: nicotinate (nicotinamide) nucleotide adenylyltransferase [Candidatus Delongbacteria bacterium]|jgi:nicotinate-nucleotide adenylyltransferase|nr:nicotinate (nicotinamide) nucleotide adenylyltransferase [Candidatus Delongbacteria bacterium]